MLNTDDFDGSLDEVFGFQEDDGYQTAPSDDEPAEGPDNADTEDASTEAQEPPDGEETTEEVTTDRAEEVPAEGGSEPGGDGPDSQKQFISVKYDGQTRNVSLEDAPGLIQKGMNYERMQERLDAAASEQKALQEKLDEQGGILETLDMISGIIGVPVPELLDQLHVNAVKGTGKTEAEAKAIIKADRLERQLKEMAKPTEKGTPEEDEKTKQVAKEVADFRKQFPDVNLEDPALVERLRPFVQAGMSLTSAYLKQENERQSAEIVRLQQEQERKQAAQDQNKRNRAKTPGSMRDSGGGRTKDLADIFEEELFR